MSHRYKNLPIGSTAASVRAYRNLMYLQGKGLIPEQPQSARVAYEISNDNLRKANCANALRRDRAERQAIQQGANEKWVNSPLPLSNRRMRKLGYAG